MVLQSVNFAIQINLSNFLEEFVCAKPDSLKIIAAVNKYVETGFSKL
jgi:hypothetical protein